jgi:signal transduction histidine kinase
MANDFSVESVSHLHLDVHPSVVFKLGEDLITEDSQAVAELIKNSYDADATFARVEVDTEGWYYRDSGEPARQTDVARWLQFDGGEIAANTPAEVSRDAHRREGAGGKPMDRGEGAAMATFDPPIGELVRGRITITDDGTGMNKAAIVNGWLTVSASAKRRMKALGEKTTGRRTPLGDKGLGRLGVQRLGELVRLQSIPREEHANTGATRLTTMIDWRRFARADSLGAVDLDLLAETISPERSGSRVEVFGLHNADFWSNQRGEGLDRDLMGIVSPYDDASGFDVVLRINETTVDLRQRAREVLRRAPIIYRIDYANRTLRLNGRLRAAELRGTRTDALADYRRLVASDNGYAFADWLLTDKPQRAAALGLTHGDDDHFLRFSAEMTFDELRTQGRQMEEWVDPGPFSGEVCSIDLRDNNSMPDATGEWRQFARALQGVRVFRDGFGIRLSDDWLGLAKKWTQGTSFYSLRPENTIGYINLTVEHNAALEETTSREQFRDTAAFRGFFGLLSAWSDWTANVQSHIRREYNRYRSEHEAAAADLPSSAGPSEIASTLAVGLQSTRRSLSAVVNSKQRAESVGRAIEALATQRDAAASQVFVDPKVVEGIDEVLSQLREADRSITSLLDNLRPVLDEQERLQAGVRLLESQLEAAQEQLGFAWESVAAGLSAETLSHEVAQISDRLRARSQQIKPYFRERQPVDSRGLAYAEYVRSAAGELTREVSRLNPALRFRRDRRVRLNVADALTDLVGYHRDRLEAEQIGLHLQIRGNFDVLMNQGRFTQVFDNLILNSEYWCRVALRRGDSEAAITVTVADPVVLVSDSGPGIDPAVESSLFEPFVTTKPESQGRGLGLFVVRQILDVEHAHIDLLPDTNQYGKPYIFRLQFEPETSRGNSTA